jgi:hypothetical protein
MTTKKRDRCDVCGIPMSSCQIASMNPPTWQEEAKTAIDTLRSGGASRSQRIAATTSLASIIEDLSKRERELVESLKVSGDEILPTFQKLVARVRELEAFNQKMAVVLMDASNAAFRSAKGDR